MAPPTFRTGFDSLLTHGGEWFDGVQGVTEASLDKQPIDAKPSDVVREQYRSILPHSRTRDCLNGRWGLDLLLTQVVHGGVLTLSPRLYENQLVVFKEYVAMAMDSYRRGFKNGVTKPNNILVNIHFLIL